MKIVVILPLYLSIQVNFRSSFKLLLAFIDFFIQFSKCEWICSICFNSLMVGWSGLEPPTSRLSGVCSNLLSYKPMWFFCGFKLTFKPLVEINGIEPLTPCLQSRCSPSWAIPPRRNASAVDSHSTLLYPQLFSCVSSFLRIFSSASIEFPLRILKIKQRIQKGYP